MQGHYSMTQLDVEFARQTYSHERIVEDYVAAFHHCALGPCEKALVSRYLDQDERILDVACGVGRAAYGLFQLGYTRVIGIDVAPPMLSAAQRLAAQLDVQSRFSIQDARCLAFGDHVFGGVLAFHAITPIPGQAQREMALRQIQRVLAPGKYAILSTFLRQDPNVQAFWTQEEQRWKAGQSDPQFHELGDMLVRKHDAVKVFIHVPSRDEFAALLEEAGFQVADVVSWQDLTDPQVSINPAQRCTYWVARAIT